MAAELSHWELPVRSHPTLSIVVLRVAGGENSGLRPRNRHLPPVDDDPSARQVAFVDAQAPHRKTAFGAFDL